RQDVRLTKTQGANRGTVAGSGFDGALETLAQRRGIWPWFEGERCLEIVERSRAVAARAPDASAGPEQRCAGRIFRRQSIECGPEFGRRAGRIVRVDQRLDVLAEERGIVGHHVARETEC